MFDADNVHSLNDQLNELRSSISDLGYQVDAYKTKTAAALGAGVFVLSLAALGAYDLVASNGGVWLNLGLSRENVVWISSALGAGAAILLILGFLRVRASDNGVRAKLERMEREYAELLERRDGAKRTGS